MLDFSGLNYWAILVAWFINCAIGAYWYSPAGFAKAWAELSGFNHLKMPEEAATKTLFAVMVSALVQVGALAVMLNSLKVVELIDGVFIGVLLWAGFVAATTVGSTLYAGKSWKFWWLNASFFFIVMALGSVILTLWK